MTKETPAPEQAGHTRIEPTGVDLARVALQQARLAAKTAGREARNSRRRRATAAKRDEREPTDSPPSWPG